MSLKAEAERRFWIGVCEEMAHQMGTPLSALMGWLDILPSLQDQNAARIEMNRNLERLQQVSERLSQIGVPSGFEPVYLKDLLAQLSNYATKRMSRGENAQRIHLELRGNPVAQANPVLLPWALENFIKGSLDAVRDASGPITLRAYERKARVFVEIEVHGEQDPVSLLETNASSSGRTKPDYRAASLAIGKHIICEIHGGRVVVKKNIGGRGGVIIIRLNRAQPS